MSRGVLSYFVSDRLQNMTTEKFDKNILYFCIPEALPLPEARPRLLSTGKDYVIIKK
jgi:hypothetical protein